MSTNPFKLFETDKSSEIEGIKINYGDFWFQIARAGGSNVAFKETLQRLTAPYKQAMARDILPDDIADELGIKAFVETILLGWGSNEHGEGNMVGKDNESIPFSQDNATKLFKELPDLFRDLMSQATNQALFRAEAVETKTKNSKKSSSTS